MFTTILSSSATLFLAMSQSSYRIFSLLLIALVLLGIYLMSKVEKALLGNRLGVCAMLCAILLTLVYYQILNFWQIWLALTLGAAIGLYLAHKVQMIEMPQMVGLLNGFGGLASMLAGVLTLSGAVLEANTASLSAPAFSQITAGLAVVVGGTTWMGSALAAAKLQRLISQKPKSYPHHQTWTMVSLVISLLSALLFAFAPFNQAGAARTVLIILAVIFSQVFGYFLAIRVGGADMPITISLLNSFSGLAGAIAGMAVSDLLLVAVGGIVGASGLILTQIMCRAMNRQLVDILLGKTATPSSKSKTQATSQTPPLDSQTKDKSQAALSDSKTVENSVTTEKSTPSLASWLHAAQRIIIVPGYGMALSQAQPLVKQLTDLLESDGKQLDFAIHPVAGRMPGHMNVLLAEVDIPYEKLHEMEEINPQFKDTDLVLVIGANDVLNPAANTAEGTPIYGMPVLDVGAAKHVIICNFDLKPGYAGVENPLYQEAAESHSHIQLLLGDAKASLNKLMDAYKAELKATATPTSSTESEDTVEAAAPASRAAQSLNAAQKVIIVPGYGMALSQAQPLVKRLSDQLEAAGKEVDFAIHPVAGRMPGHMNVLLAEVDIPYDKLHEMAEINPDFARTDVVLVIGANDVINPAANTAEGTPIYGMPVLDVGQAKELIICNFDLKPGYAGVENPLYAEEESASGHVLLLLGDAKETLQAILQEL